MGVLPAVVVYLEEEQGIADEVLMRGPLNLSEGLGGASVRYSRIWKGL